MKLNVNEEAKTKALQILKDTDDKNEAVYQAFEVLMDSHSKELIAQLQVENEEFLANKKSSEKLGLRALTKEEKDFYEKVKQSVTFDQEDIIPTSIIDNTLADIKLETNTLKLVNFAPANVQKWISASKTGAAAWGGLTAALTSELTTTFTAFNVDVCKLHVYLIVPKAVRKLSMPFVDKYFNAILAEAMRDGLIDGFLNGDGKNGPIGITKKIASVNSDSTHTAKSKHTTFTNFKPSSLAAVKKVLANGGTRAVNSLVLIANPSDVYDYIDPALYVMTSNGYTSTSKTNIEVIEEPMCTAGTAIFTLPGIYTMGMGGVEVGVYTETKALEDCDVITAVAHANGTPSDENTAYVFDPTKLEEAVLYVQTNIEEVYVPSEE